jgi:hypothetical protein
MTLEGLHLHRALSLQLFSSLYIAEIFALSNFTDDGTPSAGKQYGLTRKI